MPKPDLFFDAPAAQVTFNPFQRHSLFTEIISGSALSGKMAARNIGPKELAKGARIGEARVKRFMDAQQSSIPSNILDAIARTLKCSPVDLIPEVPLPESEVPLPLPKVPATVDLASMPLPTFDKDKLYVIGKKDEPYQHKDKRALYKFVGAVKGGCGRTHFMFQNLRGKYMLTYTNIDIGCGAVSIKKAAVNSA